MNNYEIPPEYFFRLHHVRPRFKGDIENVLIYIAEKMTALGKLQTDDFIRAMNNFIYSYPGNAHRELKTVNNWRTEISALFGFVKVHENYSEPSLRSLELAQHQDLVKFFKTYLFLFQYPGAHIKSHAVLEQIEHGVHFKPAQYILKLFKYACRKENKNIGITKAEICHCVFNDLRCTRDNEKVSITWQRILNNRRTGLVYDLTGDIIRYAGDIIDYMEIADLLLTYDGRTYYLNALEEETIIKFIESDEWFSGYDNMLQQRKGTLQEINCCRENWFEYVNKDISETDFSTDILKYVCNDKIESDYLKNNLSIFNSAEIVTAFISRQESDTSEIGTKEIGDMGENLVHGHECMRIKLGGRSDLIHLIKKIPTQFAVGYDISSVELDERKRYIEVKTTISSKPLHFNKIHLTRNEWNAANSTRDRYFVYRLMISKKEIKLFLLQDPVGLYKNDLIEMIPANGAEITFDPKIVGHFEELLIWTP